MGDASDNNPGSGRNDERLRESLSTLMDGEANELECHRVLERLGSDAELRATAISYQRIGAAIRRELSDFAHIDPSEQHQREPLDDNAELRATAVSYLGAAIRREVSDFAHIDLSASIRDALADEPIPELESESSANEGKKSGWVASFARFAVAASVAVATVVGVQSWQLANRGDAGVTGEIASVSPAPVVVPGGIASSENFGVRGIQAGLGTEQSGMTPEQLSRARGYADQVAQARFRAYMLEHAEQASAYGGSVMPFVRAASFDAAPR